MVQTGGPRFGPLIDADKTLEQFMDYYKMSAGTRGYCCLFLNHDFSRLRKTQRYRHGADIEMARYRSLFEQLNFEIYPEDQLRDLDAGQVLPTVDDILLNRIELESHDAFVAVFSTHGDESVIYGSDCQTVPIKDILNKFSNENVPELEGKPKIFIFLCCRGGKN